MEIYFCCACQAASTAASRSAVSPAFSFACLSAVCFLNHSRVATVVSPIDRKVKPLLSAFWVLICEKPIELPRGGTHVGMSDQARTFCARRKSASAQVNVAFDFAAALMSSSILPIVNLYAGPVAL